MIILSVIPPAINHFQDTKFFSNRQREEVMKPLIELYLSTDGKHTIHVQSVSQEEMDKLFPYAKELYQKIVDELGTKAQMWHDAINGNGVKRNGLIKVNNAPVCSIHKTHMQLRSGKYGEFWSCGTKLSNGGWCKETSQSLTRTSII